MENLLSTSAAGKGEGLSTACWVVAPEKKCMLGCEHVLCGENAVRIQLQGVLLLSASAGGRRP